MTTIDPASRDPTSPTALCTKSISTCSSIVLLLPVVTALDGRRRRRLSQSLRGEHTGASVGSTDSPLNGFVSGFPRLPGDPRQKSEVEMSRALGGALSQEISHRELEILGALADHLSNAEIARRLYISVRTVESHVSSLLRKLGAADRRELAKLAPQVLAGSVTLAAIAGMPSALTSFVGR